MAKYTPGQVKRSGFRFNFRDRCTLRIKSAVFEKSKDKETPMTTLTLEVLAGPDGTEEVTHKDTIYNIAGAEIPMRLFYTDDGMQHVIDFDTKLDLLEEEYDSENPNTKKYEGKVISAIVNSNE